MSGVALLLYAWWQMLVCALPLPWTLAVREEAEQYETVRIESVIEETTEHLRVNNEIDAEVAGCCGGAVGFAVTGWRVAPYTQFADVARMYGDDPLRHRDDPSIDWSRARFDDGVGDPCWPNEGRIHVKLHIECDRWLERRSECTNQMYRDRECEDGCCEQYVDPVEMCYRGCWIAGVERVDDRCGPR